MVAGLFTASLLSLLLPVIALAGPHHGPPLLNRHHDLARRAEGNVQLYHRAAGARWTFYNVQTGSAGSCGTFHSNSDFTVAMNVDQMTPDLCYKTITMTYNGKTTTASISDTCPGCPYNGLDLTEGLFLFFAPASAGVIYGDWEFAGAAAPSPSPTPTPPPPSPSPSPPPPSSSSPPPPPPSSSSIWSSPTWQSPSYTPTSTPSHTSTHNSSAALTSSSASATSPIVSIDFSVGAASGLAEPTSTAVVTQGTVSNIENLFQGFIEFAALIKAAHNV